MQEAIKEQLKMGTMSEVKARNIKKKRSFLDGVEFRGAWLSTGSETRLQNFLC